MMSGRSLLSALQGGGYVIFFRHFHSDHSVWHEDPIKKRHAEMTVRDIRGSCEEQRPLSEYGRARAKDVGEAMRKLAVPVGSVFASPYCRVIESALLLAHRPPDAILYDLMHRGGDHTEAMQNRNIRPYLAQIPSPGTNTVLMSHRPQMDYIKFAEEGEAFVFRPKGDGAFDLIATIYDSEWLEALVNPDYLGAKVRQEGGDAPSRDKSKVIPTARSSDTSHTSAVPEKTAVAPEKTR